jgi:putative acetyltransferase
MFMSRHDAFPAASLQAPAAARHDGVRLAVRRTRVSDAAAYARIMAHPDVYPNLLQMPYPTPELWQAKLAESCAPGSPHVQIVVEAQAGDGAPEVVGSAGLHPGGVSPRKRHLMMLGINVDAGWHGRGVGTLLMQSLCDYADHWLGLLRIELEVYADNHRAQALYKRFGFVQEGYHRCDALRGGAYVDSLSMARLNPKPLAGFPRG